MANIFAPNGFVESYRLGGAPTEQPNKRYILNTNSTPIYFGDPVSASGGYIQQATAGTTPIVGVFAGCTYNSAAAKKIVSFRAWLGLTADVVLPASGATGYEVSCLVVDDPLMVFKVQSQQITPGTPAGTPPYSPALIGQNVQFSYANPPSGQPNALVGNSVASIDISTVAGTTTLPFRIVDIVRDPPGGPGTDATSAGTYFYVAFNNQAFKQLAPA
jgi:hypothetical protein